MSKRRVYDHRIREEICRTGDPDLLPEASVLRTTAASWIRRSACFLPLKGDWETQHDRKMAAVADDFAEGLGEF